MFTGIITHQGKIVAKTSSTLKISTDNSLLSKLSEGMSVAVNGICLTVTSFTKQDFEIDFMPETEKKTTIASMIVGDFVNLELPATPDTFLAGHIVQGHVDGIGKLESIGEALNSRILTISLTKDLLRYIVQKGSIAINGISLTVISVSDTTFTVGIIPHTWQQTNVHTLAKGDYVTIEVDILAKYIEKLAR